MAPIRTLVNLFLGGLRAIPAALGWLVSLPLAGIQWLRRLRVELWSVEGLEQSSHLPLCILCAVSNNSQNKQYLLKLIFGDAYRERCLGRFWLWNVAKALPAAGADCSLILTEIRASHRWFVGSGNWFLMPAWLFGEVDLPRDADVNRKVRGSLQKIRHNALQCEVTRDAQQFDDFYRNMYVPYTKETFGGLADVESYELMKAVFPDCDLLLIKNREKTIAGQLIKYDRSGPWLCLIGIPDGDRAYLKMGAAAACFHFAFEHLEPQGYRKVGLGYSRPFLRDGALQFKKSWSQRITEGSSNWLALRVVSHTPATKAFLSNNPFIFRRGGHFYGAVFVDGGKPLSAEDIRQIDKDYFHLGLSRLLIYRLGSEPAPRPDPIPAELAGRIELCGI